MLASCLLAAAFIPIFTALRSSHTTASLNEMHVLARRRARTILSNVASHPFQEIKKRATGDTPPSVPGLPQEGNAIQFAIRNGTADITDIQGQNPDYDLALLRDYEAKANSMEEAGAETKVYFYDFADAGDPGLGRLTVHISWKDAAAGFATRHYVASRFVEDPFHWERAK